MLLLITVYLLLVFVLPLLLSLAVSYRSLPQGRGCPQCQGESMPLVAPVLQRISRVSPQQFQRRWCIGCGWEGVVRLPRERAAPLAPLGTSSKAAPPASVTRTTSSTKTLDLRWLVVQGESWRVMLQCWNDTGRCYGRLVFVAPSGRLWADSTHPLSGRSADEVLGQALSLPERTLASRLREVATE
jgi:hypothetical protein